MKSEIFTESFDQFASRVTTTDLALYAGVGLILWILFKDKLSPIQKLLLDLFPKSFINKNNSNEPLIIIPQHTNTVTQNRETEDVFFKLIASWKQTRDLAVRNGCLEAIKVADQMFPFLSPNVCKPKTDNEGKL